jgi:hypothetical protein
MTVLDLSRDTRFRRYLTAINDAIETLEVMRDLPEECEPVRELAAALTRTIEAIWALDLPLDGKSALLDAIAAGGGS